MLSHHIKTCDPGGPTANLGAFWSYPWRTGLCSLPRVCGDEPQTETRPTGQSFVSAGSASLPSPRATRQRAGNMETAQVQGGLWAKQTWSHPRTLLLHGFRLSPAQKQAAPPKQKTLSAFWMLHTQKGDTGLNLEHSVLLFKTQLTGAAGSGIPQAFIWGCNQTCVGSGLPSWKVLQSVSYTLESWYHYFSQHLV